MFHPGLLSLLLVTEKTEESKCSEASLSLAQVQNSCASVSLNSVFPRFMGRQLQLHRCVYLGQKEAA